jgi:hypothetical protein
LFLFRTWNITLNQTSWLETIADVVVIPSDEDGYSVLKI